MAEHDEMARGAGVPWRVGAAGGGTMAGEEEVRVLSFNILFGGDQYGPLLRVAEVIRTSQAHVVAIQVPRRPCLPSPRDRPPPTGRRC